VGDVVPEAAALGLAGLQGSSSDVGVVGYTMGGGFGWLGRKHGFAADSVKEADVVTAEGELIRVSAHENADLFWGIKSGGGNFGIVTSLEFVLYPITYVYGGDLFYPAERAAEVLELYGRWSASLPDEVTSGVAFMNFPPFPEIPEPLRGNSLIAVRALLHRRGPPREGRAVAKALARVRRARDGHLWSDAVRGDGHDKHGPRGPDGCIRPRGDAA